MTGIIYIKTDRFEVKLEGITFKAKDFESLCTLDFLFPKGKVWSRPPVVGFHVMRHPRDHNLVLLLLCIGVGCVILRFRAGEALPNPIRKFLTDERIRFVGFGVPRKSDVFPYEELGLTRQKVDIGYLAAMRLNESGYKRSQLKELARKVLGIKKMIGLTDASSFERHEHIKCAICQLFITSAIGMTLLGSNDKKKADDTPRIMSFLKSLNSLSMLSDGWLRLPKSKIKKKLEKSKSEVPFELRIDKDEQMKIDVPFGLRLEDEKIKSDVPLGSRIKDDKMKVDVSLGSRPKESKHADAPVMSLKRKDGNLVDDIDTNVKSQESNNDGINLKRRLKNGFMVDYIDMSFRKKEENVSTPTDAFVLPKWMGSSQMLLNHHGSFDDLFGSPLAVKSAKELPMTSKLIENYSSDESNKEASGTSKKPLKGILKCPSTSKLDQMERTSPLPNYKEPTTPRSQSRRSSSKGITSPSFKESTTPDAQLRRSNSRVFTSSASFKESTTPVSQLRRANSKGLNVSFAFTL